MDFEQSWQKLYKLAIPETGWSTMGRADHGNRNRNNATIGRTFP